jgi:hypothetical protein
LFPRFGTARSLGPGTINFLSFVRLPLIVLESPGYGEGFIDPEETLRQG